MDEAQSEPLGHKRKFQFHSIRFDSNFERQPTPAQRSPKELAAAASGRIYDPRVHRQVFQSAGPLEGHLFRGDDEERVSANDVSGHMFGKNTLLGK